MIYGQFIQLINQILSNNFLPEITLFYISNNGLSANFFKNNVEKAVKNLGPRFSEKLNFRLPIAKLFNDISFDKHFKSRFFRILDNWLLATIYDEFNRNSELKYIDDNFVKLKEKVKQWGEKTPITIEEPVNIDWIVKEIEILNSDIDREEEQLWHLQIEEEKKLREENPNKKALEYRYESRPFEKEINRLRKIKRVNNELLHNLEEKVNINLSNNPTLVIDGEAGSGKSHLLGDIANERVRNSRPTILLLGQHFTTSKNIENNIIHLLDLKCSFEEFLNDLNDIGTQTGSRALILIDAINEGAGARLWRDQMQGFLAQVAEKKYVGVVVTIRTTYFKSIISDEIRNNEAISLKTHSGFRGNEYAALKMFCDFHNLKQPSFPILSPEFTNPLFLKIICEGVKSSGAKEFPQGFNGVRKIFDLFIKVTNKKLEEKRDEYINRNIVAKAINELTFKIFRSEYKRLPLDEAFMIMDEKFPKFHYLLNDLIEEGLLIKNLLNEYRENEDVEVIYFSYERFGDLFIASELLQKFDKKEEVIHSFKQNTELGKLLEDDYYMHGGVLESIATLLPEMFDLEIFEVYSWVYLEMDKIKKDNPEKPIPNRDFIHYSELSAWVGKFFLNSLNWRSIKSIDNEKITKWLQNANHRIDSDDWFLKLVKLTAVKSHPMNSDRLFTLLSSYSMPERDSIWQLHLWFFNGYDDNNTGFPIRRLLDWAWSNKITEMVDEETARLSGQTLAWLLSSPIRTLRDQTTKALVNLLEDQTDALLAILKAFENIDDLYIRERLYAVCYGCILRTTKEESIKKISSYIYNEIFKEGQPPRHILLRDYSRNIIEYAIYRNVNTDFSLKLIRPPYNSKIPELPTSDEIAKFHIDHKDPGFDKVYGRIYNGVYFNVMKWDFGNKIIDPELRHFYPISFTTSKEYKTFLKRLNKDQKALLKNFKIHYQLKEKLNKKSRYSSKASNPEEEHLNRFLESLNQFEIKLLEMVASTFKDEDLDFVKNTAIPYIKENGKLKSKNYWTQIDSTPFKRWIVQRVFELGYDMKLHGRYDKDFNRNNYSRYDDLEKIGVKYQRIALHEILAVVSDNYKIECRNEDGKQYDYYKGAWQLYSRDIDPISTTKTDYEVEAEDEIQEIFDEPLWWSKIDYDYWDKPNSEWSKSLDDLPKIEDVLIKKDYSNKDWIFLEYYPTWEEPKKFGEDKYSSRRKRLHYLIQSYLVKRKDENKVFNYLKEKNFFGRWMPENADDYTNILNREKFWSPAYLDQGDEKHEWVEIMDNITHTSTGYKVMVATTSAKGSISEDKSGANFNYNIPCKALFEGLKLKYSNTDGDFLNDNGEKIVTNVSTKGILIRKKELMTFLNENNLSIIWTLLGEKIAESENNFYHFGVPCGAFHLENDILDGELKMFDRDS